MKEAVQIDAQHRLPLLRLHGRKSRVIMQPRVIDENINRALLHHRVQRLLHAGGIRHIENDRFRLPACGNNLCHNRLRLGRIAVRMHPYMAARLRQPAGNGCANIATAARDQGAARARVG